MVSFQVLQLPSSLVPQKHFGKLGNFGKLGLFGFVFLFLFGLDGLLGFVLLGGGLAGPEGESGMMFSASRGLLAAASSSSEPPLEATP
jgi:hypothetical protein